MQSEVHLPIELRYGFQTLSSDLPNPERVSLLRPDRLPVAQNETDVVRSILGSPIASPAIEDFFSGKKNVAVIVPDKTRDCRAALLLPILLDALHRANVDRDAVTILTANGTHPKQTEAEVRAIVGNDIFERYRVVQHDSRDEGRMIEVGMTTAGTLVRINPIVAEADAVLATGPIVYHYFAGYGGGAKLLMPGVAAYTTAVCNHRRTITDDGAFHSACRDGNVEGNPVALDIADAVRFYPPTFYLGVLVSDEGKIFEGVCGDILTAHAVGTAMVDRFFSMPIATKSDFVVVSAGGYPKDINFIQSHKSIQRAFAAAKRGGVMICLAECRDGIGNNSFLDWFRFKDDMSMRAALMHEYSMNAHTALSLKMKTAACTIIFVSTLPDDVVSLMGMVPARTIDDAFALARTKLPPAYDTVVIENGSLFLPVLQPD